MLSPKKMKFRKAQKRRIKGTATRGTELAFGDYAIMAVEKGRITSRQIEAARIAMTRHIKRGGRVWIKIFPHTPVTKKPLEVRMGKGKGSVDRWVCKVKPGRVMFEIDGVSEELARGAFERAAAKLAVQTRIVERMH